MMKAFGFTRNLVSLMALVIGILVDDSILEDLRKRLSRKKVEGVEPDGKFEGVPETEAAEVG